MREILPGIFTWGSTYADRPLDYDFDVLLLCDGQPVLRGGKLKVAEFLDTLA
jgi:hypothetical protein